MPFHLIGPRYAILVLLVHCKAKSTQCHRRTLASDGRTLVGLLSLRLDSFFSVCVFAWSVLRILHIFAVLVEFDLVWFSLVWFSLVWFVFVSFCMVSFGLA